MRGPWRLALSQMLIAVALQTAGVAQEIAADQPYSSTPVLPQDTADGEMLPAVGSPRTAVVTAEKVYVRCGPSRDYYPTGLLEKGTEVQVLRVRPDGWVAVVPPPGSYSWVASDFVREIEPGVGEVIADNVPAWIGSDVSPMRDHSQVSLKRGQRVRIRKSHVFPEDALQRVWYQIDPPEGEVRWIRAEFLDMKGKPALDPASPPPPGAAAELPEDVGGGPAIEARQVEPATRAEPDRERPSFEGSDRAEEYARNLFREAEKLFAAEMQKPLGDRDILSLKARYQQVLQLTSNPALRKVVQGRIEFLEKEEVRERLARRFIELVRRSREKDQELLKGGTSPMTAGGAFGTALNMPARREPAAAGGQQAPWSGDDWFEDPFFDGTAPTTTTPRSQANPTVQENTAELLPTSPPSASGRPTPPLPPGYRVVEGVLHPFGTGQGGHRRYVLREPTSGRVVGYVVETQGLNLQPYVGKLVRVTGRELPPGQDRSGLMARRIEPVRRR